MGSARCTAQNLIVVATDPEKNLLIVRGSVPGHDNSFVMVQPTVRVKRAESQMTLASTRAERLAAIASRAVNPLKASKKGGK